MSRERTHHEITLDVRYAARYGLRMRRLFGTVKNVITFAELVGGSAAFGAWLAGSPALAGAMGLLLAAVVAVNHTVQPAENRAHCAELHRRYTELDRLAPTLDAAVLDDRLRALRENDAPELEALRVVAYNDNLRENGYETGLIPETRWQRFVAFFA